MEIESSTITRGGSSAAPEGCRRPGHGGPGSGDRAGARGAGGVGSRAHRRGAGSGQDTAGARAGASTLAGPGTYPVHARFDAVRHHGPRRSGSEYSGLRIVQGPGVPRTSCSRMRSPIARRRRRRARCAGADAGVSGHARRARPCRQQKNPPAFHRRDKAVHSHCGLFV